MIGIYLSGTGNTKNCIERYMEQIDPSADIIPIERNDAELRFKTEENIVLAYPTQFSNAPRMIQDFIMDHKNLWSKKRVFIIVTMGAFAGDVTGCGARLIKKYHGTVLGGVQIKMPDSVCDSPLLKKTHEKNAEIIRLADQKIDNVVKMVKSGKYPKEGLSLTAHAAGLLGQRLWFRNRTKNYFKKVKISDACNGCGKCVRLCPMHNLIQNRESSRIPVSLNQCTLCYRCVSHCPKQAITCLGKEVIEQTNCDDYVL